MPSFVSLMGPDVEIKYEDKTYRLGAITFKDMAEYVLWYQYKEVEETEIVTTKLPKNIREDLIKQAYERCRNKRWIVKDENTGDIVKENFLSWETPEVQESANTLDGIAFQCYLSLRVNHPEITRELANRICTPVTMDRVMAKILQAQGLTKEKIHSGEDNLGEQIPNQ